MESKKLFAVFGNPILHSKSPQLFNSTFEAVNYKAFYTRIHPQSALNAIELIKTIPLAGANITAPFKEDILNLLDEVSIDALHIGAVNTIVNKNKKLTGYNTDHWGVTKSLLEMGISISNSKILVLGAGGAARAAVYGLVEQGATIFICNRTNSKSQKIASDFGCEFIDWHNFKDNSEFDVVISTLLPEANPFFLIDATFKYLLDASYKGSATMEIAKQKGVQIISGERWLLHQAVEAFKLFTGINPPIAAMEKGFHHQLNRNLLRIVGYPEISLQKMIDKRVDLLIISQNNNMVQQKFIIDDEICKAFGC